MLPGMARTIVIIDDEPDMRRLVDYTLTREGFLCIGASDGDEGLVLVRKHGPDLVLVDVMMPGMDGLEVCRRLKGDPLTAGVLVMMLTAKAEETDRVLGLELGADDYLVKPFGTKELAARVKALLRRAEAPAPTQERLQAGPVTLDAGRRSVRVSGRPVDLTSTEFDLLRALAGRPGRVHSREDLIQAARGADATITDRTIDVHIAALRRKLGKAGERVETVRGVGYRFKE
jgi:two-component system alkaline phosphatase synthesis response regulator PhoP